MMNEKKKKKLIGQELKKKKKLKFSSFDQLKEIEYQLKKFYRNF